MKSKHPIPNIVLKDERSFFSVILFPIPYSMFDVGRSMFDVLSSIFAVCRRSANLYGGMFDIHFFH